MSAAYAYADLCVDLFDLLTEANIAKQRETTVAVVHDFYCKLESHGLAVGNADGDEHTIWERPATVPTVDALIEAVEAMGVDVERGLPAAQGRNDGSRKPS